MSQKTRKNAIRAENRKALPKFFAVILTAAVVGFFGGYLIAFFGDTSADFFLAMLNEFWRRGPKKKRHVHEIHLRILNNI